MADVKFEDCGSIVMVRPVTDEAKEWVSENVHLEGWQWMGGRFSVDHRYADNLLEGMAADGLEVGAE